MNIADRIDNAVVAEAHPLMAKMALKLSGGDKTKVFYFSPFECLIINNTEQWWKYSARERP